MKCKIEIVFTNKLTFILPGWVFKF